MGVRRSFGETPRWPLLAALVAGMLTLAQAPARADPLVFSPCGDATAAGFSCATLPVPLDPSDSLAGTISLKLERAMAGPLPSSDAVVALAGGPGQAALGLGEFLSKAIEPALATRDLLVFDQRGTGQSSPLSCPALSAPTTGTAAGALEQCALQLGPERGRYTTAASVADIEAIRRAGGYRKLVLYGTSYGTKVALQYAERYPQNVEALVLDSVVPSDGPNPFSVPTFQAIGPALAELCSKGACTGITANPLIDLRRLIDRLRRHALSGSIYDGSGRRHGSTLNEVGLLGILQAGDLNPALRALLPAAVRSALRGDPDPLLRLHLLSEGLIPNEPSEPPIEGPQAIDETLFVDTSCEELPFPWQRAGSQPQRLAEALAALRVLPGSDFYPFDASTALQDSLVPACSGWPDASPAPPATGVLPDVPTLILSGAQDLRTPTANARMVAAEIPDAQLEIVPYTGHSVLGSDFSGCAELAVAAFFAGEEVAPCKAAPDRFAPTPITPTMLAYIKAPAVLPGNPGKTLAAVLDTFLDLDRQVIGATLQADGELPSGSSFGGLRGGYARLSSSQLTLKDFSFVAGVQLSGVLPFSGGALQSAPIRIGGSQASPGTVRLGAGKTVAGTLGGRHFDVEVSRVRLARTAASAPEAGWSGERVAFRIPGLARLG